MAEGRLRAVVCTSTLDLGIDWGDVDLVVNLGAPKGASRMMQRIGRANHRLDEPSKAYCLCRQPLRELECRAALDAVAEAAQDTPEHRAGALDVLAQHVLGVACAEAFVADVLFEEVRAACRTQICRAPNLTASSISSRLAATRLSPTIVSPRSGRGRTVAGACPTRASPSSIA